MVHPQKDHRQNLQRTSSVLLLHSSSPMVFRDPLQLPQEVRPAQPCRLLKDSQRCYLFLGFQLARSPCLENVLMSSRGPSYRNYSFPSATFGELALPRAQGQLELHICCFGRKYLPSNPVFASSVHQRDRIPPHSPPEH